MLRPHLCGGSCPDKATAPPLPAPSRPRVSPSPLPVGFWKTPPETECPAPSQEARGRQPFGEDKAVSSRRRGPGARAPGRRTGWRWRDATPVPAGTPEPSGVGGGKSHSVAGGQEERVRACPTAEACASRARPSLASTPGLAVPPLPCSFQPVGAQGGAEVTWKPWTAHCPRQPLLPYPSSPRAPEPAAHGSRIPGGPASRLIAAKYSRDRATCQWPPSTAVRAPWSPGAGVSLLVAGCPPPVSAARLLPRRKERHPRWSGADGQGGPLFPDSHVLAGRTSALQLPDPGTLSRVTATWGGGTGPVGGGPCVITAAGPL